MLICDGLLLGCSVTLKSSPIMISCDGSVVNDGIIDCVNDGDKLITCCGEAEGINVILTDGFLVGRSEGLDDGRWEGPDVGSGVPSV